MATVVLSAAGAALGGSIGGTVAGLSTAVIGRAVGATFGQVIDQRLLGQGAEAVETGKVDQFRLTQTGEGNPIARVFGRSRVGGQVIWASDFREASTTSGGGKGGSSSPTTTTYSYSVSLAIAICEGEISTVGRVWADGEEIARRDLNMQIYTGSQEQLPDPTIEAIEGRGQVPAYRGTAYVVLEDLALERFGNRVPQFSFEVVRTEQRDSSTFSEDLPQLIKGVALVPGTGEYALATTPVHYSKGPGSNWAANTNSPMGRTDFLASLAQLREELPNCSAASLVVSWFGSDLRCDRCTIKPKVERSEFDGGNMPWSVAGVSRSAAQTVPRKNGQPVYGGTTADAAVVEAIRHMRASGQRVMFYPFILMDQLADNRLQDPWTGSDSQPALPWRGRITLSSAPPRADSADGSEMADDQVRSFFGEAKASDFQILDGSVRYDGPAEWGMRRFILHYAALCAAAGGVSSFCIGSEMRGLTQIRGATGFPAVDAFKELAAEARALLGPKTKIGYAADWSEYFGYQPQDGSGDRYFHLDPLWSDANIDFIGIDNYMPLSDWRDEDKHADAEWKSVYSPDYLRANIEGGEGFDWFYESLEAASAQVRAPIEDLEHNEPWIWRYKDLRNWWSNEHHERISGVRQATATGWVPRSKPIWFTELGCAALDKATNQPNKFLDPKSSESSLPKFSNGLRDDLIQRHYLQAMLGYWSDDANNPTSDLYEGRMIDMQNAYVWAWDTRPFPRFPNNLGLWEDGKNYPRGHWLNGRVGSRSLASVVEEICLKSGLKQIDTSRLFGVVRGYTVDQVTDARSALQPLMLRFAFDAIERDGVLKFVSRDGTNVQTIDSNELAECADIEGLVQFKRDANAEVAGRVRVRFLQSEGDHDIVSEEAVLPDTSTHSVTTNDLALSMTRAEGRQVAERWLSESRVSRDSASFALPPSKIGIGAGDIVRFSNSENQPEALFRVDRIELGEMQIAEAVRIESEVYLPSEMATDVPSVKAFVPPTPVFPLFLDLPLMTGDEKPHAPHLAITAQPWPGAVAVYASEADENYRLSEIVPRRSVVGQTESILARATPGLWDESAGVQVKLLSGGLESRSADSVLSGANLAAIGDGSSQNWELIQFRTAELIEKDTYLLRSLLRGQLGTDAAMKDVWPKGSWFVLLDDAPQQICLNSAQRRRARHYRIGPAQSRYDDPSFRHSVETFDGVGLRPYSPCHIECKEAGSGDLVFEWIRRTRINGDSWDLVDVPIGEDKEQYLVRVVQGDRVLREEFVETSSWTYLSSLRNGDGLVGALRFEVAQVSSIFGPGPFSSLAIS